MKLAAVLVSMLTMSWSALCQIVELEAADGRFTAVVVLNNDLRAPALIDLGATTVVVCEHMARRLGLSRGEEVVLETAGPPLVARRTRLRSVCLGCIELRDVGAVILSEPSCHEVLVGMTFLRQLASMTLKGKD